LSSSKNERSLSSPSIQVLRSASSGPRFEYFSSNPDKLFRTSVRREEIIDGASLKDLLNRKPG